MIPVAQLGDVASEAIDRGEVLIAGMAAMLITIFLGPKFIEGIRVREFGQQIREEGPAEHHSKAGTPTMGGLIIFVAIAVPYLVLSDRDTQSLAVFGVALACAGLGFIDDYIKISKRRSLGLPARWKLLFQIALAVGLWWVATEELGLDPAIEVRIFDANLYLGPVLYVILIFLVIAGSSNGVNLVETSPLTIGRVTTVRILAAICARPAWTGIPAAFSVFSAASTRLAASASDHGDVATKASNSSARR